MLFQETELIHISGILGFLSICIAYIYGIIVLIKYIKTKDKSLFYFFLAIIFTVSPWYPSGLGYIYWLITGQEIIYSVYVLLGTMGVPIALISWLQIYMPALHQKQKGMVTLFTTCLSAAFYIYVFIFLFAFANPVDTIIGIKRNVIDIDYRGFVLGFLAFSLLVSTITGNEFSIHSLRLKDNPVLKWKGRFLILSFNLFAIGALGDGFIPLTPITLIIFRTFLVLANTFYYLGFILPKWMRSKILHLE
ncbi:MAG: hypothetical protein ACXACX_20185 [Candidatus Hodarchaeales archaeon]|jgi:hypothetical protein